MAASAGNRAYTPGSRVNATVLATGLIVVVPLIAVLLSSLGRDPHFVRSPLIGQLAPGFSLTPVDGGAPVSLESLRGRPVVLNFWAAWCAPCYQEHAALTAAAASLPDVQLLGVVYEDEEANVRSFLRERGAAYPALMDPAGKTAIAYGIYGVPETYFIDGEGRIVEKYLGPLSTDRIQALVGKARGER